MEFWSQFSLVIFAVSDGFHMGRSQQLKKKKKVWNIHIRCEKYFLCGYNLSTIPDVYLKNRTAPNPRDQQRAGCHWSVHFYTNLHTARHYQTPNQTSLNQNMESWGTSKNFSPSPMPKCEDKTVDHREKGA